MMDWIYCELEMPKGKMKLDVAQIASDGETISVYRNVNFDGTDFINEYGIMANIFAWHPIPEAPEFKRFGKTKYYIRGIWK